MGIEEKDPIVIGHMKDIEFYFEYEGIWAVKQYDLIYSLNEIDLLVLRIINYT